MRQVKNLTVVQLEQRYDELRGLATEAEKDAGIALDIIRARTEEVGNMLDAKLKGTTFNKGIINPVPPGHEDISNTSVITPKAPSQLEREHNEWEKSFDT
jgi:hypothetical protein